MFPRRPGYRRLAFALLLPAVWLAPVSALAHGFPARELSFWGPFGLLTAQCVYHLERAAEHCFSEVFAAHRACRSAELAGGTCNQVRRIARIATAQQAVTAAVDAACLGGQLTELLFAGFDDAKQDMQRACAEADTAAGMVYAPLLTFTLSPADRRCVAQTATISLRLSSYMLRTKSPVLNRSAFDIVPPTRKLALLRSANERIAAARQKSLPHVQRECPQFARLYNLDPLAFLTALGRRTDCLLGTVHFQKSITCQFPVCGDGIPEAGEACDDGNRTDGDACRNNCTRAPR